MDKKLVLESTEGVFCKLWIFDDAAEMTLNYSYLIHIA